MEDITRSKKIAWVSGASSGIGRAVALRLATEGWTVAVTARRREALETLEAEHPGRIHAFPADVTQKAEVSALPAQIQAMLGPIDLSIFSAGSYRRDSATAFKADDLREMVDLNIMGTAYSLEAILPAMLARGRGQIGVVASVAGYNGLPGGAFYGATKAALNNLCEGLKPELETKGVDLRIINPGFVKTPLTDKNDFPMPFLISVEEAAEAIVEGLKGRRYEIIFPWKMALAIKILHALPQSLRFAITRRMLRKS